MSIDIFHRYTRAVLYHSETAQTIEEAVVEAAEKYADLQSANLQSANLRYANLQYADLQSANLQSANLQYADLQYADLRYANLQSANLRYANLRGSNLSYSNLPDKFSIASLCFGGWPITVTPTKTAIGCEQHPNKSWLGWAADAPEITAMHPNAAAWWTQHREAVCAVIRDVMGGG